MTTGNIVGRTTACASGVKDGMWLSDGLHLEAEFHRLKMVQNPRHTFVCQDGCEHRYTCVTMLREAVCLMLIRLAMIVGVL